jgi:RimJ/RimL family protein N-acetyltransferase
MPNIRWARPDECDEVQDYLFENMGKIPHDRWRNILDCRWNKTDEDYGVIVEKNSRILGFLGIVFADRILAGKPHRTGNITSWYLEKSLRRGGLGQEMLELITSKSGVTYTATSANFRSGALLKKIGWDLMENQRLFWYRNGDAATGTLLTGTENIAGKLSRVEQKIINDHNGLNVTPHLFTSPDGERLFFVTYVKTKGEDDTAHYEILHTGDFQLLTKNAGNIANLLLPEKNAVLSSDKRFLTSDVKFDDSQELKIPRYFKPNELLAPKHIDFLYGEVILLDLKIY